VTAAPTAFGHPPGYEAGDSAARVVLRSRRQSPDEILAGIFGEPYTRYRDAWRRAASFQERPPFPLHLDVDTNTTCNLKCVMCPAGAGGFHGPFEKKPLPFGVYERALAEAQDHGLRALRLGVTGEPLLRPDIVDMVRLAKKAGILDVMLITNGTLLTPDTGRALIDVGLTRLMVSLDAATAQTYEKIRPGGRFDQVVRNL
jgi:MoaA/NifB/PqqE/SkfB family radical SAM enzyme